MNHHSPSSQHVSTTHVPLDAAACSVSGPRPVNEDFAAVMSAQGVKESPRGWLAVLADGVSTSGQGQAAAHSTGAVLLSDYPDTPIGWDTTVALDRLISAQNNWLWRQNQNAREGEMETTLTALAVGSRFFTVAHVGDCRCYLIRGGRLHLLTQDHTRHIGLEKQRGPLTRALGLDERVMVDYRQEPVQLDDVFILVSDGVWSVLTDKLLQSLVTEAPDAAAAASLLCKTAVERGTQDNASAIVMRVLDWAPHDLPLPGEGDLQLPLPPKLTPGEVLDGLTVIKLAAESGVTRVWQVQDNKTSQLLALKTLVAGRGALKEERTAIAREHWLAAHAPEQVAQAVMPTQAPCAFYYLFEWIEGPTLANLAEQSPPLSASAWITLAREAVQAVGALHRRGIIHRDIKPQNLVREASGHVRVLDLGVAITRRRDDRASTTPAGTPAYINPEQWDGAAPTERSDLFALGVTLYYVLTQNLPYGEVQPYQLGRYQREPTAARRHRHDVPLWITAWLARAFSKRENERYETAEEMMLALERGAQSGSLTALQNPPLLNRGTTTVLWLALGFSVLLNLLLILLRGIL